MILYRMVHNVAVARPLGFDRGKVRDRALLLFWRRGYQAASLADLLAAMRIGRGSFYAAFGDKRGLFLECLDRFAERTQEVFRRARAERPPVDALQYFFERQLVGPGRGAATWGCLLVNTVLETAGVDEGLSARASAHLGAMQTAFGLCLRDAGCAPERADALASMLMLLNEGVRVASRRRVSTRDQLDPIATAFVLLRDVIARPCSPRT
jgi:TetR/AcrR family transcriptional repressor of nem operon